MTRIYKQGQIEIWAVPEVEVWGTDYWVYGIRSDPVVFPSRSMAHELAAA